MTRKLLVVMVLILNHRLADSRTEGCTLQRNSHPDPFRLSVTDKTTLRQLMSQEPDPFHLGVGVASFPISYHSWRTAPGAGSLFCFLS